MLLHKKSLLRCVRNFLLDNFCLDRIFLFEYVCNLFSSPETIRISSGILVMGLASANGIVKERGEPAAYVHAIRHRVNDLVARFVRAEPNCNLIYPDCMASSSSCRKASLAEFFSL